MRGTQAYKIGILAKPKYQILLSLVLKEAQIAHHCARCVEPKLIKLEFWRSQNIQFSKLVKGS